MAKDKRELGSEQVDMDYLTNLFGSSGGEEEPAEEAEVQEEIEEEVNQEEEEEDRTFTTLDEETTVPIRDIITRLVDNNIWDDVAIKFGDNEYSNLEELLENENPTKEMFEELLQYQKTLKEETLNNKYLKVENPDDIRTKIAEAVLRGEEYEEIVEENNIIEEIRNLDFTQKQNAKNFIAYYYQQYGNYDVKGDPDAREFVINKIDRLDREGDLIDEADKYRANVINAFEQEVQQKLAEQREMQQRKQQTLRQQQKEFRDRFKEREFSDSFIKKARDLRFGKEQGQEAYVKMLREKLESDPSFEVDFMHFMLDPEDFIEKSKKDVKFKTQRRMIEISGKGVKSSGRRTAENTYDGELDPTLAKLFNNEN